MQEDAKSWFVNLKAKCVFVVDQGRACLQNQRKPPTRSAQV